MTFRKWTSFLLKTAKDRNVVHHSVYIVTAPFCAMFRVNDGKGLTADGAPGIGKLRTKWRNFVEVYETDAPFSVISSTLYELLYVRLSQKLKYG